MERKRPIDPREPVLDPDAPATADEVAAADALREALGDPSRDHDGAALLRALADANAPRALDEATHQAIVARALESTPRVGLPSRARRRTTWALASATVGVLALAATTVLVLGDIGDRRGAPRARVVMAAARSTQALFTEPFPRTGGESARVDRIALSRASDFRDNRFALHGVR